MTGFVLFLFASLIAALSAFIGTDATSTTTPTGCTTQNNFTTCQTVSTGSFITSVLKSTVVGIDGAPLWLNAFYLLIVDGLLIAGVILMVIALVPTLGN